MEEPYVLISECYDLCKSDKPMTRSLLRADGLACRSFEEAAVGPESRMCALAEMRNQELAALQFGNPRPVVIRAVPLQKYKYYVFNLTKDIE